MSFVKESVSLFFYILLLTYRSAGLLCSLFQNHTVHSFAALSCIFFLAEFHLLLCIISELKKVAHFMTYVAKSQIIKATLPGECSIISVPHPKYSPRVLKVCTCNFGKHIYTAYYLRLEIGICVKQFNLIYM